ncbi:uncharacterized protein LOC142560329 [Dermacentor variabilis]|uniref:uncharacterized protein LOC142560329 n=1 Tax=Dermacentor variabilis TaxID=34621 RepID=UPI003F5AFDB8
MPEEEDDDEKKGKDKKGGKDDKKDDKKDKKGGKDDKKDKDKGGKDKGGKEKHPKSPKSPAKASAKASGKGSAKGSVKGSPKSDKRVEESSDKIEKSERSDKSEKSERAERADKPQEKPKRPALGPYKAPPPSETMLRAMAEPGPVYAERFYNDEYEDEQEGRNYVEVQMYQRRSGTNISEGEGGGHGMGGGGTRGQTFYVDVPPPRPPRPPAFDEYYVDEQPPPPPRRARSERLERQSMTQQPVFYDESCGGGTLQRQRQDAYFDYSEPAGPAGSVPRLEPPPQSRRPIVLPPTTVVVNLSESGAPLPPAGPPARPGGYERQLATGASMRSHEEFRHQQSDMHVRNAPMTTQLTQQLRDIALQHQRPMDDNVISSTERVIYEVIRKMESTSSETSEERPPGTILRNQAAGGMSPMSPQRPAMSPQRPAMSPQRLAMSPPGMMSPGMIRGPPMGMIRSPISAGSRGYLVRAPSGPLRVATPRIPVQYPHRWVPSSRGTPLTPAGRSRRRDDGMSLFPERSLIMLLVFLFLFVLVVVILAISGMTFPGFSKSKDRYA